MAFVHRTTLPLRLVDVKWKVLWRSGYFKGPENFCRVLRSREVSPLSCQRAQKDVVREALRSGEAILTRCCSVVM